MPDVIARNAKAVAAGLGALAAYLIGVLDPNAIGLSAFAGVTTVQWLGAVLAVLATYGITWGVSNRGEVVLKGAHVSAQIDAPETEADTPEV